MATLRADPEFTMSSSNDNEPPSDALSDGLTGLHILLVEDSLDISELVKTFLELEGATVAGPAATTAEAKKLLAEGRPHVALVDLHLRDNHAFGLIAQLRELEVPASLNGFSNIITPSREISGGGGRATSFARRRRFCAMAPSVNSSCAQRGPRNLRRPSLKMRLR